MTAAQISPNVFSLREPLNTQPGLFLTEHTIHRISFILIIHHIHMYIHIFYLHVLYTTSFLLISWQAGCSQILVSVTGITLEKNNNGSMLPAKNKYVTSVKPEGITLKQL
jgi:hypothetical protein